MSESNNNIPMRITQLPEATEYPEGSYIPIAKAGWGTKKIDVNTLTLFNKMIDRDLIVLTNLCTPSDFKTGGYYGSNGAVTSSDTSIYSEKFFPVLGNTKYYWYFSTGQLQILTYDSNLQFIERLVNTAYHEGNVTLGGSVAYIRVSIFGGQASLNNIIISEKQCDENSNPAQKYIFRDNTIDNKNIINQVVSEEKTSFFSISPNVLNFDTCTKNHFIDGSGNEYGDKDSEVSDYISINANDVINFTLQSSLYLYFYDSEKTFINRVSVDNLQTYTAPQGGYIRFGRWKNYFNDQFMITINVSLPIEFIAYGAYIFDYADDSGKIALSEVNKIAYSGKATKTSTRLEVEVGKLKVVINKYNNSSIRAVNLWRTNAGYISNNDNGFYTLWLDADTDGVVSIVGESDFLGGYHGDETQTFFKLIIDGVEYEESATFTDLYFNEIVLYCESDVYHCNTSSTPDVIAFKRNKIIIFNKDGYIIKNYWKAQEALSLGRAYMGMLPVNRFCESSFTNRLMKGYYTNQDFYFKDYDTSTIPNEEITNVIFNTNCGNIGIEIKGIITPSDYKGNVTNYNTSGDQRLKVYLDLSSNNKNIQVNDIIKAETRIFVK